MSKTTASGAALGTTGIRRTIPSVVAGLAFVGGGCATVFCLACFQGARRAWFIGGAGAIAVVLLLLWLDPFPKHRIRTPDAVEWGSRVHWGLLLQVGLWTFVGLGLLVITAVYGWRVRSAEALLLALWIFGTMAFAVFVNWTVAGRSVLTVAPAAGIIAATWPARRGASADAVKPGVCAARATREWCAVAAGLALALLVAFADQSLARTARDAASASVETYRQGVEQPRDIWFTGNWGFQEYMQRLGARIVNQTRLAVFIGDAYIIPRNNVNLIYLPEDSTFRLATLELKPLSFCSTMSAHASFYAHLRGPLPFAFGRVPPEKYDVEVIKESMVMD
jgi:hypothetical protein